MKQKTFSLVLQVHSFRHKTKEQKWAQKWAQPLITDVPQQWKLNLNADKSEVCPFSTWINGSISPSAANISGSTTLLVLYGYLDSSLTFNERMIGIGKYPC